ncbi:MAG: thermonuclease family protein [Candidatus Pacebacteria bacterium]|jgi:micrococcal nuclease|nr:thermonuclease family protein [Candidatus Paceibacterota bacterium]
MHKNFKLTILGFALLLILPVGVFAHPGRTDAQGCHTCRKNCSSWGLSDGEYHCHNTPTTIETKEARTEARQSATTQARDETPISNSVKTGTIQQTAIEEKALVSRIIDGDTIELLDGKKVRYIGIDTPETVDPRKAVQCFGKESKEANSNLVLNKVVILKKDVSETDKYGRLLRYIYLEDGTFVNLWLVKNGYAFVDTYPPDVAYSREFLMAEQEARQNKRGLWDNCQTQK